MRFVDIKERSPFIPWKYLFHHPVVTEKIFPAHACLTAGQLEESFAKVVSGLFLFIVACSIGSLSSAMYQEDCSDLDSWVMEGDLPEFKAKDSSSVSLQLGSSQRGGGPGASCPEAEPGQADMETLFRRMRIYSEQDPSLPMGMSVFQSLPQDVQSNGVVDIDEARLAKDFPYLDAAIRSASGDYIVQTRRLSQHLFTYRVIVSLDRHIKYLLEEKKELKSKVHQHVRMLFASMMDMTLPPMDTRKKTIQVLQFFWGNSRKYESRVPPSGPAEQDTHYIFEISKSVVGGATDDQQLNTFQNVERYIGLPALKILMPEGQSKAVVQFMRKFPTAYALVSLMHDPEQKKWLMRNYKGVMYLSRKDPSNPGYPFMADSYLARTMEPGIKARAESLKVTHLEQALVNQLKAVFTVKGFDHKLAANSLIHAVYRQRKLNYSLTRPFQPGDRMTSVRTKDNYYFSLLEGADGTVTSLLTELDRLAKGGGEQLAAEALMVLIEAPLGIIVVEQSVKNAAERGEDAKYIFEWLASISDRKGNGLYLDQVLSEWSLIHMLPEARLSSPEAKAEELNTHFVSMVKGVKSFRPASAPSDPDNIAACICQVLTSKNLDANWCKWPGRGSGQKAATMQDVQMMLMRTSMVFSPGLEPKALPSAASNSTL